MEKNKILIIDDDEDLVNTLSKKFKKSKFEVYKAFDSLTGIEKIYATSPDLILLNIMLPQLDGYKVCRMIKENLSTANTPIIVFSEKVNTKDRTKLIKLGVDAYIIKPVDIKELLLRIENIISQSKKRIWTNPLTMLPGNIAIQEEIKKHIENNKKFAFCFLDIDNFKAFNDYYGYERGDRVIKLTAELIKKVAEKKNKETFIGHIGGDDFVLISPSIYADELANEIAYEFDKNIKLQYDKKDLKNGYFITKNRYGNIVKYNIMTLSIAIVTNENRYIKDLSEISRIAAEIKFYLKSKPKQKSEYMKDRRTSLHIIKSG